MIDFSTGAIERRNYFEFNGKSSKDFHLYLSGPGIYNAPGPDVESVSIPGLNGEIMMDNAKTGFRRYPNVDIEYDAFFTFGLPEKTREVKAWLLAPTGYQILQDSFDPDFYRMAMCTQAVEFEVENNFGAQMTLTFSCKPQRYAVSGDSTTTFTSSGRTITNPYEFPSQPNIRVYGSSRTGTLTIGDYSVVINSWPGSYIDLNCETQNAYMGSGFCNSYISSDDFPVLMPGSNTIRFTGGISSVEIQPRWWTL